MSTNSIAVEWEQPFLKDSENELSLKKLYQYVESEAKRHIGWYWNKKKGKARMSWAIRLIAILFFSLGGFVPIIKACWPHFAAPLAANFDFGQFGYLLIAVAAAGLGLDKFFGYSTGWIRYITTAMSIEKSLEEFRMEWTRLTAGLEGKPASKEQLDQLVQLCKQFSLEVHGLVTQETMAWATEFQNSLVQLAAELKARAESSQKEARVQAEASQPGAISLTVANGAETDRGFTVMVDGKIIEENVVGEKCEIPSVPPGQHTLRVSGTISNQQAAASDIVEIKPGTILKAKLEFVKARAVAIK